MISTSNAFQLVRLGLRRPAFAALGVRTAARRIACNVSYDIFNRVPSEPSIISIKVTNRCNLRCPMCMQWGNQGTHRKFSIIEQKQEIDVDLFRGLVSKAYKSKPLVLLSGGEPLLHTRFEDLISALKIAKLPTSLQTNGVLLTKKADVIRSLGDRCYLLISIDGAEREHDSIRGKGTYQSIMSGLAHLRKEGKRGLGKPIVGAEITITHKNASSLRELLRVLEVGIVDWAVLNLQWTITRPMGETYQSQVSALFGDPATKGRPWSWGGFVDKFSLEEIACIKEALSDIASTRWKIPVLLQPPAPDEIDSFFLTPERSSCGRSVCRVASHRVEVLPDGLVYSCKPFADIPVGDLSRSDLTRIWSGTEMNRFRNFTKRETFSVCAKCPMLYTFGK